MSAPNTDHEDRIAAIERERALDAAELKNSDMRRRTKRRSRIERTQYDRIHACLADDPTWIPLSQPLQGTILKNAREAKQRRDLIFRLKVGFFGSMIIALISGFFALKGVLGG